MHSRLNTAALDNYVEHITEDLLGKLELFTDEQIDKLIFSLEVELKERSVGNRE